MTPTRPLDRILWPAFSAASRLDTTLPVRARQVVYRVGHAIRSALEAVAERTPIVRESMTRYGDALLREFRHYTDGLITRDVQ